MSENKTAILNNNKSDYLKTNRGVDIKKHFEEQKRVKDGGLEGIEIRKTAKSLGKNDFLKLLVTQLTHQDPTSPMKDQQFIAQMAQFSSLEQMQNVSSSVKRMTKMQATDLVGKFVIGKDNNGKERTGVAQAFFMDKSGQAFLKVGKNAIKVESLTLVGEPKNFKREYGGTADVPRRPAPGRSAPAGHIRAPGHVAPATTQTTAPAAGNTPEQKAPNTTPADTTPIKKSSSLMQGGGPGFEFHQTEKVSDNFFA